MIGWRSTAGTVVDLPVIWRQKLRKSFVIPSTLLMVWGDMENMTSHDRVQIMIATIQLIRPCYPSILQR